MTCYLAPRRHSWLSDQNAYSNSNSESLNIFALPYIKIQCCVTNISGGMLVREFKDCHFGSYVGYKHIMIYVVLHLHVALHDDSVQSGTWFWRRACAIGYLNERCLAILNLHVAPMSPAKIQLNPTYCSGGDVI